MMAALLRCGVVVGPLKEFKERGKGRVTVADPRGREGGLVILRSAGYEDWDEFEWYPISGKHVGKIPELDIVRRFEVPT